MRSKKQNEYFIREAFNDYIETDYFDGVVTPGGFYDYCKRTNRAEINKALLNRMPFSVQDLADKVSLIFDQQKANASTGEKRIRLIREAFLILESKKIKHDESFNSHFDDENDAKELLRYIQKATLIKLFEKKIDIDLIPNWSRAKGNELLKKFAYSNLDDFKVFLNILKTPNGLLDLSTLPVAEKGIVYAKETEYLPTISGYIVVKLGNSTKSDLTRAVTSRDIKLGHECRIFGTDDIENAEEHALQQVHADPLCKRYDLPNRSPRSRNQEYFEIPTTHFNTFSNYVKTSAKRYLNPEVTNSIHTY
ncbi:hypothetical protein GJ207_07885 [Vibrio parahaemolyticus]|nr:hypothetical protein [Vibrio parahaemolyticus]EHH1100005.1 hypothetical protein [Vibrio parahaemolyticus]HCE2382709.1 hypothetical protein [Vibrio parahaemolyticus]